ncbi:MAG: long-chain-acyl-CoA synthetase [Pseudomonadota bacterium]
MATTDLNPAQAQPTGLGARVRDVASAVASLPTLLQLKKRLAPLPLDTRDSLGHRLEANAERFPTLDALHFEGQTLTWAEFNARVNQVAHALASQGVKSGDSVSLMMQNRFEYLVCLLAINKLGAIGGLINTNLTGKPLTHCINVTESVKCIVGSEVAAAVGDCTSELALQEGRDFLFVADTDDQPCPNWAQDLGQLAAAESSENPTATQDRTLRDKALYVFTSGTTGLPKAAILSNRRFLTSAGLGHYAGFKCTEKDRLYIPLPLYHATGLMVGFGSALSAGASSVLRRRFSASKFLDDIREHGCTCLIYIGELCRYLVNQPEQAGEADNPLRAAMGNGLRPDVWPDFKRRFGIQRVTEFYGSSEGNVAFANLMNKECTIGFTTSEIALIRYDVDNDEMVRDENGRPIEAAPGEPGLLLGQINENAVFEGYTNPEATEKKIVRNLREDGDAWFNTGDLIRQVDVGYTLGFPHYQFVDRVGDTFRWKSENVSTNEVGEIINAHPAVAVTNAYGVEIPGTNGRAGMAAITLAEGVNDLDLADFAGYVRSSLPAYAVPVFLRVQQELAVTGTFKLVKGDLKREGYQFDQISDPVYVMKPGSSEYELLTADFKAQLDAGTAGY